MATAREDPAPRASRSRIDDSSLGWVSRHGTGARGRALLDHLVARDMERKALGAEVLHLYREINLIYSFSEKLAALLDLELVAKLTLQEARQMIVATDGLLMLLDDDDRRAHADCGVRRRDDEPSGLPQRARHRRRVAASGVGEIVNDVDSDARRVVEQTAIKALVCAPLNVGERVIGVIALGSTIPMSYTAAELKLLNTLALQTATAIENARLFERTIQAARERERLLALHKEAEVARAKLESELNLAARIQADLFPAELPLAEGYELAARNRPARRCGGDYYDALSLTARRRQRSAALRRGRRRARAFPAALVMSNMQATLRALLGRTASLPVLAAHASDLLFAATSPEKYVTAALVQLAPARARSRSSAPVISTTSSCAPAASSCRSRRPAHPSACSAPACSYDETTHALERGDYLVLFSDGVTDARDEADEEFGEERLFEILRASVGEPGTTLIDRVFTAIDAFAGGAPQFDDITMLVARRLPVGAAAAGHRGNHRAAWRLAPPDDGCRRFRRSSRHM